jgi:F0F1-type ATP synthase delta subunit
MKQNKTKIYAKALAEVIFSGKADEKKVVDNFLKLLIKTGQEKKAKEILDLTEDLLLQKRGKRKIIFQTARRMTADQKKLLRDFVKDGDVVKEKVNHELIAGIKIIINNSRQFDSSMQSKLQNIKI